jgi:hypothetical protein
MKPNRNIERRLTELERSGVGGGEITLRFEDGSSRIIPLPRGRDACDLFADVMRNPDGEEASVIRRSVSAVEPGGSRIIEVCRALLPEAGEPDESEETRAASK